jgi:hypothetical protein
MEISPHSCQYVRQSLLLARCANVAVELLKAIRFLNVNVSFLFFIL